MTTHGQERKLAACPVLEPGQSPGCRPHRDCSGGRYACAKNPGAGGRIRTADLRITSAHTGNLPNPRSLLSRRIGKISRLLTRREIQKTSDGDERATRVPQEITPEVAARSGAFRGVVARGLEVPTDERRGTGFGIKSVFRMNSLESLAHVRKTSIGPVQLQVSGYSDNARTTGKTHQAVHPGRLSKGRLRVARRVT